ncbi:hypothetical protein BDF14DRAFT_1974876, partial [Spinellus fusiger]
MTTPHGLPAYKQRSLSLASFNVPRRYHLPIVILRLLSLLPAAIGVLRNFTRAWVQPPYDATGLFTYKSTPLIYTVALLW